MSGKTLSHCKSWTLSRNKPDPAVERFQSLIENKYTRGLTAAENTELDRLEADFRKSDETFYGPIVERVKRLAAIPKPSLKPGSATP